MCIVSVESSDEELANTLEHLVVKVDNNRLLHKVLDALDKGLMRRVLLDVIVSVFHRSKLNHKAMGYSVLWIVVRSCAIHILHPDIPANPRASYPFRL